MEPVARRKYKCILLQRKHQDLKVEETGLYIDTKKGYLGSSPDGMVECSCCGSGVLEVKCPLMDLLTQDIKKKVAHTETSSGMKSNTDSIPLLAISTCKQTKPTQAKGKKLNKGRKKVEPKPIYLCGSCQQTCLEIDELDNNCESDYSIGCDKCRKWFHWGCIGFDGMLNMDKWYCDDCEASKENSL
ncbi:unnamed protein product [Mytilus coruscus]|uniref:PHD-type domain-containing protein n=1 Tax=Mytilus coruscus TaxID=42192 RepID=A0A6J7ZU22_MYTCO|nr:unnamed protein product [Mytilus coruscus]